MNSSTSHPALDAIFWKTLTGPHAIHAVGAGAARRYARGFSPIIAFADTTRPDFAALAPFCAAGEVFYCEGWDGACPDGWRIDAQTSMLRMVWEGGAGSAGCAPDAIALGASEGDAAAAAAVTLAELCRPGPFGPRTIELGDYYGYVDTVASGRLIAMAGQRMRVPGYTEISGVCSHPEARGRGLARQLMDRLIHQQMARDERPFLHVMRTNESAHALYQRMGFIDDIESTVRVLTRLA